jgi:integrase
VLNKKKIYRYLGEEERPIENRGYTTEEIAKMLEVCDERVKALLLFLSCTGLRIRAVVDLKLEDLTNIPDHDLYQVKVYSDSKRLCSFNPSLKNHLIMHIYKQIHPTHHMF